MANDSTPKDFDSIGVDDFYVFLDVDPSCSEKDITKSYRKRALKCHPDKNPDDKRAAEEFQRLSRIFTILTDKAARAAYDNLRKARKRQKERTAALDAKRRKFKDELEKRESVHRRDVFDEKWAAQRLEQEIKRLREEGLRKVQEQEELIKAELATEKSEKRAAGPTDLAMTLKIKWKAKKNDELNGGYDHEILTQLLQKYGTVRVIVSSKRKGSAIANFSDIQSAKLAFRNEKGLIDNPIVLAWAGGEPPEQTNQVGEPQMIIGSSSLVTDTDYESMTLTRLKQAQERKRLIEQMQREDADEAVSFQNT
ncbi:dnaJ homolog subfamily C member 17-like [Oscarella lobularis]|uniref:dnaJ homolog subfamily C member 17-like n=1 Tax=Oscarella lobularis TaxID=121494 RepID=UPI0033142457